MVVFGRIINSLLTWEKPKQLQKNLPLCHFAHHTYHMDSPGIESEQQWWEAGDKRPDKYTRQEVKRTVFWDVMLGGMVQKGGGMFSQTARCHRQENLYSPTKFGINHDNDFIPMGHLAWLSIFYDTYVEIRERHRNSAALLQLYEVRPVACCNSELTSETITVLGQ
jgi:hypothetical protein